MKELSYRVDEAVKEKELITSGSQQEWERARWITANNAKIAGAKLSSVYSICTFPWEAPEPETKEDLLSRFPKKLN